MSAFPPDHFPALAELAPRVGMTKAGGRWGPCPVCGAERASRDRSDRRGPVAVWSVAGVEHWKCHAAGCDAGGIGAPSLVAAYLFRAVLVKGDPRWREVFAWLRGESPRMAPLPTTRREAPPTTPRPPVAALTALWGTSVRVSRSMPSLAAAAFLERRRFPVDAAGELAGLRELPTEYAWPEWWPSGWASAYRLALPAFEPDGTFASLHGRSVGDVRPKTRWPRMGSGSATGLLLADWAGVKLLRGDAALLAELRGVVVVEGFTDLLRTSLAVARVRRPLAVLGAASGGFPALARVRIPAGLPVYVGTDADATGDKYARDIANALDPRPVRRLRIEEAPRG